MADTALFRHMMLMALLLSCALASAMQQQEQPTQQQREQHQHLRRTEHFLVFVGMGSHSPSMDLVTTAVHLATRGHKVTVLAPQRDLPSLELFAARHAAAEAEAGAAGPTHNLDAISLLPYDSGLDFYATIRGVLARMNRGGVAALGALAHMQGAVAQPCAAVLQNATLLQVLRQLRPTALLEVRLPLPGMHDSCGCILAHLLDLPLVHVHGCALLEVPPELPQMGSGLRKAQLHSWRGWTINQFHHKKRLMQDLFGAAATGHLWQRLRAAAGVAQQQTRQQAHGWLHALLLLRTEGVRGLTGTRAHGDANATTAAAAGEGVPGALQAETSSSSSTSSGSISSDSSDSSSGISSSSSSSSSAASCSASCRPVVEVMFNSFLLEPPRLLAPHQVLVGPVSVHPPRTSPSPPEVAAFLDGSDPAAGTALVAFGSMSLFGQMLSADEVLALAQAFTDLAPMRVIWNLGTSSLPQGLTEAALASALGPNTLVVPVVDYNDVLGHPSCRLFVTHAGIHSSYEAAYHGVPVVTVPFQMEQLSNALILEDKGMGVLSGESVAARKLPGAHDKRLTRAGLGAAMQQVLQDGNYSQAAAAVSAALQLHCRQRSPLDRAADAIEVALVAHSGSRLCEKQLQQPQPLGACSGQGGGPAAATAAAVCTAVLLVLGTMVLRCARGGKARAKP